MYLGCIYYFFCTGMFEVIQSSACKLYCITGIFDGLFCVAFLLLQVHGNVCLASVVVTQTLDWKLHAFDVLSEFDGHNESAVGPMLVNYDSKLTHWHHFFSLLYRSKPHL